MRSLQMDPLNQDTQHHEAHAKYTAPRAYQPHPLHPRLAKYRRARAGSSQQTEPTLQKVPVQRKSPRTCDANHEILCTDDSQAAQQLPKCMPHVHHRHHPQHRLLPQPRPFLHSQVLHEQQKHRHSVHPAYAPRHPKLPTPEPTQSTLSARPQSLKSQRAERTTRSIHSSAAHQPSQSPSTEGHAHRQRTRSHHEHLSPLQRTYPPSQTPRNETKHPPASDSGPATSA